MSLNIDHSLILKKAETRSTTLKKMESLIQQSVHAALDGLRRAETLARDMFTIYSTELDAEGQKMLPDVVNLFIRARHQGPLETVISGNSDAFPGLEKVAALFPEGEWVPEPMHPYDDLSPKPKQEPGQEFSGIEFRAVRTAELLVPNHTKETAQGFLKINFWPGYDRIRFPDGCWVAQHPGVGPYGVGLTPTMAFENLETHLEHQAQQK